VGVRRAILLLIPTITFLIAAPEAKAVEVYLFRGAGDFSFLNENAHFSRSLDRIADTLNSEGIHAEVFHHGATADALQTIRKRKPKSVAFVGHSMGALTAMRMARKMRAEGIRVAYVATLDIPGPVFLAGDNVEWAENYFSMAATFGVLTNVRRHPHARNIHVSSLHLSIDDSREARDGVLTAIRAIHAQEQILDAPPREPVTVATPASNPTPHFEISPKANESPLW